MREIFQKIRNGTAVERLAVISDLVSILGISLVTIASAPIVQKMLDINMIGFVAFIIYILLCTGIFILVLGLFQRYLAPQINKLPNGPILSFIIYLIFLFVAMGGASMFLFLFQKGI